MTAATAPYLEYFSHGVAGRRVLVAEDSPTTHEILKLLLTQRGHHVDIATDGEQALEALRRNHYDVALLDFHLPTACPYRGLQEFRSCHPQAARHLSHRPSSGGAGAASRGAAGGDCSTRASWTYVDFRAAQHTAAIRYRGSRL